MNTKAIIIALLLSIFYTPVSAIEPDKRKHFSATMIISTASFIYFKENGASEKNAAKYAFATAFAIGFIKELTDKEIDNGDLIANGIGSSVPLIMTSF